ncbi:transposase [Streptomyces violascens]|uniref:transposase n=1 Tax=Streptomyces violascens TaxID=67381 RepID=UPI003659D573
MGSKQRTYTPEFREGAVRIVIERGRPIPEVAEELGVRSGTLHSWVSRWRRCPVRRPPHSCKQLPCRSHVGARAVRRTKSAPAGAIRRSDGRTRPTCRWCHRARCRRPWTGRPRRAHRR